MWWILAALAIVVVGASTSKTEEQKIVEPRTHRFDEYGYPLDENGQHIHKVVSTLADGAPPRGWDVHHVNGIKSDNRPENLVQLPRDYHFELHGRYGRRANAIPFNKKQLIEMRTEYLKGRYSEQRA
jgi:hypothetical protein